MESSRGVGNRYETHYDSVTLFSTVAWSVCSRNSIRSNKSRNACDDTVQGLEKWNDDGTSRASPVWQVVSETPE